jgi:DNA segregation ATPase FtsK/SpoIIIE, S-DNA-T family
VGVGMALIGLLTMLSLVSVSNSAPTGNWLAFLNRTFGWGAYLFPMGLLLFGLWLVLRNFERIPTLSIERIIGIVLLYANMLTGLHFLLLPAGRTEAFAAAQLGQGGGVVGAFFLALLQDYLGLSGAAVAILAWLLIALALALDVTVMELFGWIPPLVVRFQDWWDDRRNHFGEFEPRSPASRNPTTSHPVVEVSGKASGERPVDQVLTPQDPGFVPPGDNHGQTWVLPRLNDMLDEGGDVTYDDELDRQRAHIVEETLASFGAPVNVVEINRGPTITQFGVEPDFIESRQGRTRVRVGKIASLADDLALALSARRIRVEAPAPGKGYVGIEVPNDSVSLVALRDVIEAEAFRRFKSPLKFALGQDVAGHAVAADLAGMPHLLIAGQTGSGKSVCVNTLICCLLLHNTPEDLRLVMVDPKRVELTGYNGIPHLLAPVVVEMERVVGALQWILREMDQRYHKLAQSGARNIIEYNAKLVSSGEKKLPYLVVIIDELADLMMLAPEETERTITRLAQLARATGIHLVIATQRPSVDVVTGLIKANFPARIAFAVASGVDSRVILDQPGAERLLGRGDMLFQAPDAPAPLRLQGAFVSDTEIMRLVYYWRGFSNSAQTMPMSAGGMVDGIPAGLPLKQIPLWEEIAPKEDVDPLLKESIDLVRKQGRASISMLQRRLRIGYTRAARLIETMQSKGIIGVESSGVQGFEVLDYGPVAPPNDE